MKYELRARRVMSKRMTSMTVCETDLTMGNSNSDVLEITIKVLLNITKQSNQR